MIKVEDLVKGQVYALKCPINNYALKPFVFACIKPHRNNAFYDCYFFGIQSPNLIYPIKVVLDGDYAMIDAILLTPLEVELL